MAGYSKLYCIGGLGGFQGADGINPIDFQILVGDADRQCLESHYFKKSIRPLGKIRVIIPQGPDHPNALLDACIAFYPQHFETCPSFKVVKRKLEDVERLDFHQGKDDIPDEWSQLREEAKPFFRRLNIFEAKLSPIDLSAL